jgi:hypothetical protein
MSDVVVTRACVRAADYRGRRDATTRRSFDGQLVRSGHRRRCELRVLASLVHPCPAPIHRAPAEVIVLDSRAKPARKELPARSVAP